jgi:hypothetical protein
MSSQMAVDPSRPLSSVVLSCVRARATSSSDTLYDRRTISIMTMEYSSHTCGGLSDIILL